MAASTPKTPGALTGRYQFRILENPVEMTAVEELQRIVWPGNETEVVPAHMLLTASHNGGLVIGAFETEPGSGALVGFLFGFPGLYFTPDGPRPKHCSHIMGVHPEHRNQGIGFTLKRAQWQLVRRQGLDRISWNYDPLVSRNAYLNIARLGATCNTYHQEYYGQMRDGLNAGLLSDRFEVDWWVNSRRVFRRLSKKSRRRLDLAHYLAAETAIINPTRIGKHGWPQPEPEESPLLAANQDEIGRQHSLLLLEIPPDFMSLKSVNPGLALEWRLHTRAAFTTLFERGYLVTDFVHLPGASARSYYVLSYGESTL